ncbi:MAG: translocation/assembly module TamB domain-containing protein [Immundisolibacter sp.]
MACTLLLAVLLVGLAGYVALGSDGALRALARGAVALAGDRLSIGEVRGNLRQGVHLRQVELHLDGVRAQAVAIDWQPGDSRLWRRQLALGRITLDDLRVTLAGDGAPSSEPRQLPSLAVPGRVTLQTLDVRGLTLTVAGGAPLRLESLHLAGSLAGSRLQLGEVSARAQQGSVDAALRLDFAGAGTVDGLLQATVHQPDGPPLHLTGSVGGRLAHGVQLALRSRAPAAARLVASVDTPLAGGPWQAHLWLERGSLSAWRADLPPWRVALDGRARGRGADITLALGYRLEHTPAGEVHGRLAAQGAGAAWDVSAQAQAEPARIDLSGRLDLAAATAQGQLDWQALQWPFGTQTPRLRSPSGSARLSGRLDDWTLTLEAALAAQGQSGELTAKARGDTAKARLESVAAQLLGGSLQGQGELRWAPELRYAVTARARGFDPGLLWPQWAGQVNADVSAGGDAAALDLKITSLGGRLRGQPLGGRGEITWQPQALRLSDVDLRLGRASLRAAGTVLGAGPPLVGTLDVPAADELLPGARGRLQAQVRISGSGWAQASVQLQAAGLAYGDQAADTLNAQLDLDRPRDRLALQLDAAGVRLGERRLALRLAADGAAADHAVKLNLARNGQRLALEGRGALLDDGWRGRISQGRLDGLPPQAWTLAGPLELELRRTQQSLSRHCWQAGGARVCADGRRAGGVLDLAAQVEALPLAPLLALADADLAVDGQLDGRLRLHRDAGPLRGELHLAVPPGELRVPTPDGGRRRFAHGGADVDGQLDASGGRLSVRLAPASPGGVDLLAARLYLPPLPAAAEAPLRGTLAAQLPDVGLFDPWLPQLAGLAGRIEASVQVEGTLGAPRLTGEAHLRDARAAVPVLGIELREAQLRLSGDGGDTLRLTGSVRSGEGVLHLRGQGRRLPGGLQAQLALHGERVQVFDTAPLQAQVDPDIDIVFADGRLRVSGELRVPAARIDAQDRPPAVQTSPDVVVQGREVASGAPLAAEADLRVVLGDDVRVDAYGFQGQLGGAVRVQQRPDGSAAVNGQVTVTEGQYTFYGQRLPVTEGELRYAGGAPDNPALRITAARQVGEVTAGVRLRGTAKAPTTQLYSTPPMPQADILSYLVLGRPMQQAKGSESDLLMQAAASVGLRGGGALVRRLGQSLGFDEARLGGDGNGGAKLALGRYLTPRLYVGYGLALAEQTNAVTLRYTLTEHWLLEVVSGLTQTADLLYQLER